MPTGPSHRATGSPASATGSTNQPVDGLFDRVYDSLKGLAHQVRNGRAGETLNTTALVHEAFVKLSASKGAAWKDEAHFFAIAARAMRQIVVDAARREGTAKRGANSPMLSYDDAQQATPIRSEELVALDEALERLQKVDPRRATVVEHRIFAGLTTEETARILNVSAATVERDWRAARAWLALEIGAGDQGTDRGTPPG